MSSIGIDEREIKKSEEYVLKARKELLSRPQIHVDALMSDALVALRRLESRAYSQAEAQITVSAQGFWGCLATSLTLVAAIIVASVECAACAADPTKVGTCLLCAAGIIGVIAAIVMIIEEC